MECVSVEVLIKKKRVLIGTFYRPQNSNEPVLCGMETSIALAYYSGIRDIIIMGDFNIDLSKPNTLRKNDICNQYSSFQLTDEPVHFTERSSSLIDILTLNNPRNL